MTIEDGSRLQMEHVTKIFPSAAGQPPAVDDVSLHFAPASAVSIVGTNGAGKSTLLKLIAGVLAPTAGLIRRPSRCASLLELGAGFHDDLTGLENLELTVELALTSRAERRGRISTALELAGLGDAVELPIKHMSSGMVARLACAVAVASRPDLLLVDEVLAVGDGAFQREVLSRVADLVQEGTCLVLVTHSLDLAAVSTTETIWLHDGAVRSRGPTPEVLAGYEAAVRGWGRAFDDRRVGIERLELDVEHIEPGDPLELSAEVVCIEATGPLEVRIEVRPVVGDDTVWMRSHDESFEMRQLNLVAASAPIPLPRLSAGRHDLRLTLDSVPISPTKVEILLVLSDGANRVIDELACELEVGGALLRPHYNLTARYTSAELLER